MVLTKSHQSLFRSTASTVALSLLIFQFILVAVTVSFVMLPMAKRSADDLSALLVLSAQTWVELPPETRRDFELELLHKHQFMLFENLPSLPKRTQFFPYLSLLDSALSARLKQQSSIKVTELETTWFWAEIRTGGKLIRIGFPKERISVDLPTMLMVTLIAMIILTLLTALVLARRIAKPITHLSLAAQRIGEGKIPESLPETEIKELSGLALAFNQMAYQVRELLSSRTVMLSGISHDLRTPLARMRLAIELLPENTDSKLIARLQHDIQDMDRLIGEFLVLSRDMQKEVPQEIDLSDLLHELIDDVRELGAQVEWAPSSHLKVSVGVVSLRRVIANLLSNAYRYGNNKAIYVELTADEKKIVIRVLDQGRGIPANELENVFRPFYRLESSRNNVTGGSGLGLAISRQLADANGWKIELLPRETRGTEARITIVQERP